jgi:Ca2+-binding RTX toxin-like protein
MMAAIDIRVKVNSAVGQDTLYAFPGAYPHKVYSVGGTGTNDWMVMGVHAFKKGQWYDFQLGYTYKYYAEDGTVNGNDITGGQYRWYVRDQWDPSNADLMQVETFGTTSGFPIYLPIGSLSSITLDGLVGRALAAGHTPLNITVRGNLGNDTLRGSFWADKMTGDNGKDSILGGDGNDTIDGGNHADTMVGGYGDDRYYVGSSGDKIVEASGGGRDIVYTSISYKLVSNVEDISGTGASRLTLTGNSKSNSVSGSSKSDTLKGEGGNDTIYAGSGNDVLVGGSGKDTFFFFSLAVAADVDTIRDFKSSDDTIMLPRLNYPAIALYNFTGPLPKDFFRASESGKAKDANDHILYDTDDGRLYYDPDGNGAQARVQLAKLDGDPKVLAADIFIV